MYAKKPDEIKRTYPYTQKMILYCTILGLCNVVIIRSLFDLSDTTYLNNTTGPRLTGL